METTTQTFAKELGDKMRPNIGLQVTIFIIGAPPAMGELIEVGDETVTVKAERFMQHQDCEACIEERQNGHTTKQHIKPKIVYTRTIVMIRNISFFETVWSN